MPPAPFVLTSVPRLRTPSGKSPEPLEECFELVDYPLLLVGVRTSATEPRYGWQDPHNLSSRSPHLPVPKSTVHIVLCFLRLEPLLGNNRPKLFVTPRGDGIYSFNTPGMYRGQASPVGRSVAIYGDEQ